MFAVKMLQIATKLIALSAATVFAMITLSESNTISNNSSSNNLCESSVVVDVNRSRLSHRINRTTTIETTNENDCENDLSSKSPPSPPPSLSASSSSASSGSPSSSSRVGGHSSAPLPPPPLSSIGSKLNPILSRGKRYIAFPEGSSFSVAVCATIGIIGNPRFNYASYGLNWGMAYDLPNETWILNHLHGFANHPKPQPPTVHQRRSRRQLYTEIERIVDNMGYNGKGCLLRALCESRRYLTGNKMGMLGEMLKTVFSLPKQRLFRREIEENSEIEDYDHAYRHARSLDCSNQFHCEFSILDLILGGYSEPPQGYYMNHHIEDLEK